MIIENSIGWCDETGNKVTGCDKVSPGCKNCYAQVGTRARVLRAQGIETWGVKGQRYHVKDFASKVRRLNKLCVCDKCHESAPWHPQAIGERCRAYYAQGSANETRRCNGILRRIRLFADSNSDWLDDKWPIETLADLLKDIHDCPNVDFQLLTKRPENWLPRLDAVARMWACDGSYRETPESIVYHDLICQWRAGNPPSNVWLGVSVEDQKRADERIPLLLQIPAAVRFLSVEPLLERVDLNLTMEGAEGPHEKSFAQPTEYGQLINWIIVGGESGPNRRDCGVEVICDVARQCAAVGVPCFVKQASAFKPGQRGDLPNEIWALKQFPN